MSDNVTLTGLVATSPRHITTSEGLSITSFRLASSQRRYNRAEQRWIDGDTNWYTVSMFRSLATNASLSLGKGDRVIVTGRLRIRDWQDTDRSGTTVEIEAETIGHDMMWGTSTFTRVPHDASSAGASPEVEPGAESGLESEIAASNRRQSGESGDSDDSGWASVA